MLDFFAGGPPVSQPMQIRVKLFAIVRDRAGVSELSLDLPEGATVRSAVQAIATKLPAVRDFLPRAAFAVNHEYFGHEQVLHDGDELAVIPPVSGG
jgi:molybdopterin converting factor subunit 1